MSFSGVAAGVAPRGIQKVRDAFDLLLKNLSSSAEHEPAQCRQVCDQMTPILRVN
jgi:hypothetical protein